MTCFRPEYCTTEIPAQYKGGRSARRERPPKGHEPAAYRGELRLRFRFRRISVYVSVENLFL